MGGERREGKEEKKEGTKRKKAAPIGCCEDEWFHLLFYSFRRPCSGLRSNITALTFLLFFFFLASCKDACVAIVLIRSETVEALTQEIAAFLKNAALG